MFRFISVFKTAGSDLSFDFKLSLKPNRVLTTVLNSVYNRSALLLYFYVVIRFETEIWFKKPNLNLKFKRKIVSQYL